MILHQYRRTHNPLTHGQVNRPTTPQDRQTIQTDGHILWVSMSPTPVDEEVLGQPFGADDLEDDLIGLQGLDVHSAGQGWVQTLGQTLPNDQPLGQQRVAQVTLQGLGGRTVRDMPVVRVSGMCFNGYQINM